MPSGFDALVVHAAAVKIADLLLDRSGRGCLLCRGGFQDLAQHFLVLVLQLVEAAPTGIGGLDGIALDPAAGGELEEVLAGLAGGVEIVQVEAMALRIGRLTTPPMRKGPRPRIATPAASATPPATITQIRIFACLFPGFPPLSSPLPANCGSA